MSTDRDRIKDKIAKLMAMATDQRGNEHEAEAALRQAQKLMAAHAIELNEIATRTGTRPVWEWRTVSVPVSPKPVKDAPIWMNWIAIGVAKFTDCTAAITHVPPHGACIKYSGDATDVEYAVWLTKNLRDEARILGRMHSGNARAKEEFRRGYALRVYNRLDAMRKERDATLQQATTATGTALMVVNQKIAERDERFGAQQYGKARPVRWNTGAHMAGQEAGSRANLNRPVGSQPKAKIGSAA